MKNSIYILSYDRDNASDTKALHNAVISNPLVKNWFHYIKSSYILVASTKNASILTKSLDSIMQGVRYFLMEVNPANCNGFLPQKAWDWIDKVVDNAEGGISFDSFLGASMFRLRIVEKKATAFKIGKTAQPLEQRRLQEDYRDLYPNISELFTSQNKDLVSIAEAEIIDEFINSPKCDNSKDGSQSVNDNMGNADKYYVYVVWR